MKDGNGFVVVFMTAPDAGVAATLAKTAVVERLAACANIIGGVRSIYGWKGELHDESEVMVIFKTVKNLLGGLEAHIRRNHPYEVPEFVAMDISSGLDDYLQWIVSSTDGGAGEGKD